METKLDTLTSLVLKSVQDMLAKNAVPYFSATFCLNKESFQLAETPNCNEEVLVREQVVLMGELHDTCNMMQDSCIVVRNLYRSIGKEQKLLRGAQVCFMEPNTLTVFEENHGQWLRRKYKNTGKDLVVSGYHMLETMPAYVPLPSIN